jgi:hypothetical protein
MADRRRNRSENRPRPAAPLTGAVTVDDETAAALALFNARLSEQAERERTQRRIDKAQREKDAAAARVRELENDTKATAEQRSEAAAAYKAALDALERVRRGEPAEPPAAAPGTGSETEADTADSADAVSADADSADADSADAVEPADEVPGEAAAPDR